jgi:membrane protein implicated in regulation of membrane protease activity
LSTVPSFHVTFFFARRFSRSTTVSAAGGGADEAGAEEDGVGSTVTVADPVAGARVAIGGESWSSPTPVSSHLFFFSFFSIFSFFFSQR